MWPSTQAMPPEREVFGVPSAAKAAGPSHPKTRVKANFAPVGMLVTVTPPVTPLLFDGTATVMSRIVMVPAAIVTATGPAVKSPASLRPSRRG